MIFLLLIICSSTLLTSEMLTYVAPVSTNLNSICLKLIPNHRYWNLSTALICGNSIESESLKNIFIQSSLYHLIVVSASHLVFYEMIFSLLMGKKKNKSIELIFILFCVFYSLVCLLQPPLVRATISLIIRKISAEFKLGFNELTNLLFSIIVTIFLSPSWVLSPSLLLSSICQLSLIYSNHFNLKKSLIPFLIFIFNLPILWGWSPTHPLGIIINIFFTPLLGFVWLPFVYLASIFKFLLKYLDLFDEALVRLLKVLIFEFNIGITEYTTVPKTNPLHLWLYFWTLFLFLHIKNQVLLKKRVPSDSV